VSSHRIVRPSLFLAACALALSFAPACNAPVKQHGFDNEGLVTGRLAAVNPLDVVVLKPENHTGRNDVPLDLLRRELQSELVTLRYSPLALDYVDKSAIPASYRPGALGEQGVLQTFITGWDDSHWRSNGRLVIDADIYLLDSADPATERALWGGHVTRTLEMAAARESTATQEALLHQAVARFVGETLASLPPRNPEHATAKP
jgi:hypothetical protein